MPAENLKIQVIIFKIILKGCQTLKMFIILRMNISVVSVPCRFRGGESVLFCFSMQMMWDCCYFSVLKVVLKKLEEQNAIMKGFQLRDPTLYVI